MKIFILFGIIAVAVAAPATEGETMVTADVVPIVRSTQDFQPDGSYKFSFETAEGYIREETGTIVNAGKEDAYVATAGLYRYLNPEGVLVEVRYTADTKGFIPRGSGIPQVPVMTIVPEVPVMTVVPEVPVLTVVAEVPVMTVVPEVPVMTVVPEVPVMTVVPEVPVMTM